MIKESSFGSAFFRFVHSRLREHAESIAFFGGGYREKTVRHCFFGSHMFPHCSFSHPHTIYIYYLLFMLYAFTEFEMLKFITLWKCQAANVRQVNVLIIFNLNIHCSVLKEKVNNFWVLLAHQKSLYIDCFVGFDDSCW